MDLTELNPLPVIVHFDVHALELRYFDLRAIVWATRFFGSMKTMYSYLNDHKNKVFADVVAEVVWHLISDEDREDIFQDSPCYFKRLVKEFPEKDGGSEGVTAIFFDALQKINKISFPDPPEPVNYPDGSSPRKQEKPAEECWAKIFVEVSSAIKCDLDKFYAMTIRQIDVIRTQINVLKVEHLQNMALVGQPNVKFSPRGDNQVKKEIFTDEDIAEIMRDQENFMSQFPA